MADYTPDRWLVIKLTPVDTSLTPHYRVFGTWGSTYLSGQSWQMNSGITSVESVDNYYEFKGSSGSIYRCGKNSYGYFGYGMSILSMMIEEQKDRLIITVMDEGTDWMGLNYG